MYNIKTFNNIAPEGLAVFDGDKYTIGEDVVNPDAILVRSAKLHDLEFDDNLLCISRAGAGTNNIPVERCCEKGIVVFNTPGDNSEAVKELALCALILSSRDILGGVEWVKSIASYGKEIPDMVERGKSSYTGPEILGKSLGVIGLGAIGSKIANDAMRLGMKVYGYDPYLSVDAAWHLSANVIHATSVDEIYENCDYITIHIPYKEDSTRHFIGKDAIAKMKKDVRILNLARGELVDEDAVIEAIDCGKVACYVTDFPNEKTADVPRIIAIPHLGASTPESEINCAVMAARELKDYVENGNISNSVNMPRAVMPRNGDPRLCVIHKNIPDMIAKITTALSVEGVNIENMVNAGIKKRPYAYTMIDMDSSPVGLNKAIEAIEGVVRVRVI